VTNVTRSVPSNLSTIRIAASRVPDVIDGPNRQPAAQRWFGSMPDRMEIAKRVSPITYVRAGLPPIVTIHRDADMNSSTSRYLTGACSVSDCPKARLHRAVKL
jgi:hypothetical protein